MQFYIYVLYSGSSNIYYVGYTSDFEKRLLEHNTSDKPTFTSKHRPWQLKAVFYSGTIEGDAMKVEKFIKRQKSRRLIEKMIAGDELSGILAHLVRVPQVRD